MFITQGVLNAVHGVVTPDDQPVNLFDFSKCKSYHVREWDRIKDSAENMTMDTIGEVFAELQTFVVECRQEISQDSQLKDEVTQMFTRLSTQYTEHFNSIQLT